MCWPILQEKLKSYWIIHSHNTGEPMKLLLLQFLGLLHGFNWLYLLNLISISLLWIHTGHVMCSWTHLGPSQLIIKEQENIRSLVMYYKFHGFWDFCSLFKKIDPQFIRSIIQVCLMVATSGTPHKIFHLHVPLKNRWSVCHNPVARICGFSHKNGLSVVWGVSWREGQGHLP